MPEDAIATMNREWPAYEQEIDRRGLRHFGRELGLPQQGLATVRVRDGQTLVSDGPFVETKEFVAGFGLLECADLAEAIEVESMNPVARFHPFEIRGFRRGPVLDESASAFRRGEDGETPPYLLTSWRDHRVVDEPGISAEWDAWRMQTQARGAYILGGLLAGPETARTLRFADGQMRISDGPFLDIDPFVAGIDVVSGSGLEHASELAATHPAARHHAIEVRPFYRE